MEFLNNILIKILHEDQVLHICGNNLLVARCGRELEHKCHKVTISVSTLY